MQFNWKKRKKNKKNSREEIKEKIDKRYDEYLKKYSNGFSVEELKTELFFTKEDIMVAECDIEVLDDLIKVPEKTNDRVLFSGLLVNLMLSLVLSPTIMCIIGALITILISYVYVKKILKLHYARKLMNQRLELEKEILYMELKMLILEEILMNTL